MEIISQSVKKADGGIAKVQITGYRSPITDKVLAPDMGWDYNPAVANNKLQQIYNEKLQAAPEPIRKKARDND